MFGLLSKNEWDNWYNKIYGFYFRRLDNITDVEDLTAETLNSFFLTKSEVEDQTSFIFKIARNKLNTFLAKKYKNQIVDTLDENLQASHSPNFEKFKSDLAHCISKYVSDLDQQILNLCVVEDFQSKEVATKLDISPANVRTRLHRSLKLLKEKCKHLKQF